MKKNKLLLFVIVAVFINSSVFAQEFEYRLGNATYNSTDPDGAGPAKNSVTFTLQLRTKAIGSSIPISIITVGVSYQSSNAMLPTGVPCGSSSGNTQPSNITTSAFFPGYTYNNVNQCSGIVNFTTGGQTFDRRANGTFDGGAEITITNTWVDVYTTTLWGLNTTDPQAGYIALNSTNQGSPGSISNFELSNDLGSIFQANSLTYTTPLSIGSSSTLPVNYTNFTSTCTDKGALIRWSTSNEINADYFELQRSKDGNDWSNVGKIKAKGNSTTETNYEKLDDIGGAAFYRLKQFDVNGNIHFSSIIKTNCDIKSVEITVYPVPARDVLNVVVQTDKAIKTQLGIYDAAGRMVRRINSNIVAGNNNLTINLVGLSNGQYIIRSLDYELPLNKKFTIIH